MKDTRTRINGARQQGVTSLFVTLVVLLIMMILGITVALLSGSQFRLAGNLQLESVAFNAAETTSVAAHSWLNTDLNYQAGGFTTYSSSGSGATPWLYPMSPPGSSIPTDPMGVTWTDSNSCAINADGECAAVGSGGDDNKRYIIQKIGSKQSLRDQSMNTGDRAVMLCNKGDVFRITARGTTAKGTVKFVQTTVVKRLPETPDC